MEFRNDKRIDNKHSIVCELTPGEGLFAVEINISIAKRLANGDFQPIPDDEPVILFRGRDKLALPMLEFYRALCKNDGCTDFQLDSIDDMLRRFREFADESPTMKQPGSTKGL